MNESSVEALVQICTTAVEAMAPCGILFHCSFAEEDIEAVRGEYLERSLRMVGMLLV
jgi:hypothetical protein